MADKEEKRIEVLREFFRIYRPLQKTNNLRLHSRFSVYGDNFIKIYEYQGETRGRLICRVEEENETLCYERAIQTLKEYEKREREKRNEQKAG